MMHVQILFALLLPLLAGAFMRPQASTSSLANSYKISIPHSTILNAKITPNEGENMNEYRKSVMKVLKDQAIDDTKLGGRELLNLIIKKWGVAYDIQLRKTKPFGNGSENIYVNVMWRYFGQQSFPMNEREYLEHLEAIGRYVTSLNMVTEFKSKISESKKRPNAYFGYAVPIPLNVDPKTADRFFENLEYT